MPQVHRESGFRFSTRYSRYYKENYGPGLLLDISGITYRIMVQVYYWIFQGYIENYGPGLLLDIPGITYRIMVQVYYWIFQGYIENYGLGFLLDVLEIT